MGVNGHEEPPPVPPGSGAVLALITARGGSKTIPRKNVLPIAGHPLIAWTIQAAHESGVCERVVVSTDDSEIADVARRYRAEVPFLRPTAIAGDGSAHIEAALHALSWFEKEEGYRPAYLLLLQPTCPLRTGADIRAAVDLRTTTRSPSVVSVCEASAHPALCYRIAEEGGLVPCIANPANAYLRRQDLSPTYALNGALYLNDREVLIRERTFVPPDAVPYIMPPDRSWDIDTPFDWRVAEFLMQGDSRMEGKDVVGATPREDNRLPSGQGCTRRPCRDAQ